MHHLVGFVDWPQFNIFKVWKVRTTIDDQLRFPGKCYLVNTHILVEVLNEWFYGISVFTWQILVTMSSAPRDACVLWTKIVQLHACVLRPVRMTTVPYVARTSESLITLANCTSLLAKSASWWELNEAETVILKVCFELVRLGDLRLPTIQVSGWSRTQAANRGARITRCSGESNRPLPVWSGLNSQSHMLV